MIPTPLTHCPVCDSPLSSAGLCSRCLFPENPRSPQIASPVHGWTCPRCQRVNAPWVTACHCAPQIPNHPTVTCQTITNPTTP